MLHPTHSKPARLPNRRDRNPRPRTQVQAPLGRSIRTNRSFPADAHPSRCREQNHPSELQFRRRDRHTILPPAPHRHRSRANHHCRYRLPGPHHTRVPVANRKSRTDFPRLRQPRHRTPQPLALAPSIPVERPLRRAECSICRQGHSPRRCSRLLFPHQDWAAPDPLMPVQPGRRQADLLSSDRVDRAYHQLVRVARLR